MDEENSDEQIDIRQTPELHEFLPITNPKFSFWQTFDCSQSSLKAEVQNYMIMDLGFSTNNVVESTDVSVDHYQGIFDENSFAALYVLLRNNQFNNGDITFLRTVSFPSCSECNRQFPTPDYVWYLEQCIYRRCNRCGSRDENSPSSISMLFTKLDCTINDEHCTRSMLHEMTFTSSKAPQICFSSLHIFKHDELNLNANDIVTGVRKFVENQKNSNASKTKRGENQHIRILASTITAVL